MSGVVLGRPAYPKSGEHFASVPATTIDTKEFIIPSGETWRLYSFAGSAAYSPLTCVAFIWDLGGIGEELLASTHGDGHFEMSKAVVGDGVKKLAVKLQNDSASAYLLGGCFKARLD